MQTHQLQIQNISADALSSATAKGQPDALQRAEGYLELGLTLEAWEVLEALKLEQKGSLPVLLLHLRILVVEKAWPKVNHLAASILEYEEDCAAAWYALAQSQAQQGKEAEASRALIQACDLDPCLRDRALKDALVAGIC